MQQRLQEESTRLRRATHLTPPQRSNASQHEYKHSTEPTPPSESDLVYGSDEDGENDSDREHDEQWEDSEARQNYGSYRPSSSQRVAPPSSIPHPGSAHTSSILSSHFTAATTAATFSSGSAAPLVQAIPLGPFKSNNPFRMMAENVGQGMNHTAATTYPYHAYPSQGLNYNSGNKTTNETRDSNNNSSITIEE